MAAVRCSNRCLRSFRAGTWWTGFRSGGRLFAPLPLRFEAGTANFVGAIALGEAIRYIGQFDPVQIEAHEHTLLVRATELLGRVPGLRIYGTTPDKCAIVSFNVAQPLQ